MISNHEANGFLMPDLTPMPIRCRVSVAHDLPLFHGLPLIRIEDVGRPYKRYWGQQELRDRIAAGDHPEAFVAEGSCYRHVYEVDADVPADIRAAFLAGRERAAA